MIPVCLPWPSELVDKSQKGTIIGWGRTSNRDDIANKVSELKFDNISKFLCKFSSFQNFHTFGAATDTLQAVQNVPVLERECQQHFSLNTAIQFCAGEIGM